MNGREATVSKQSGPSDCDTEDVSLATCGGVIDSLHQQKEEDWEGSTGRSTSECSDKMLESKIETALSDGVHPIRYISRC